MPTAGINPDPNERPIVTIGDDLNFLTRLMPDENSGYNVENVFRYMLKQQQALV